MLAMFDNVDAASIPAGAQACAGYAGGRFPSWRPMVQRFPHLAALGRIKSIAINDQEIAHVLDVERGDATPAQAPGWVRRMLALQARFGIYKPAVYADRSTMPAVQRALADAGLKRNQYMLWIADWTHVPHLPAGFEACQWTDRAGPNDESLCLDSFFPPLQPPQAGHTPHGTFAGHVQVDDHGRWSAHGEPSPGGVTLGGDPRLWWAAKVMVNRANGQWQAFPLPAERHSTIGFGRPH